MKQRNFRISALLETSDHDGYCSGEECEYGAIQGDYEVQIPAKDVPAEEAEGLAAFKRFLPEPMVGDSAQSHWCDISCRCTQAGLGKHEYRYTVLSATELLPTDGLLLLRDVPLGDKEGTLLRVKHCGSEEDSGMLRLYFVNRAQTAEVPIPPGVQVLCDGGGEALQPTTDQQQSFILEYPDRYTVTFEGKELIALSHKWHCRCLGGDGGDQAAKK